MRVLVLNKVWMAIGHTDWKRAFHLLCAERAEVLEYYERTVKTSRGDMFLPAVIRLVNYDKLPICKVAYSKRAVLERDDFECQYCGISLTLKSATLDHVWPKSKGGQKTFKNTVAACQKCNNKKGNRNLENSPFKLRKKPIKPDKPRFRLRLHALEEEWRNYLPRKILNEFQTFNRDSG